jgi:hypothetical protein
MTPHYHRKAIDDSRVANDGRPILHAERAASPFRCREYRIRRTYPHVGCAEKPRGRVEHRAVNETGPTPSVVSQVESAPVCHSSSRKGRPRFTVKESTEFPRP